MAQNEALGQRCRNYSCSQQIVDFSDPNNEAGDTKAIRKALGEKYLNYLECSHGAHIGITYAEFFPQRIKNMALDVILSHSQHGT